MSKFATVIQKERVLSVRRVFGLFLAVTCLSPGICVRIFHIQRNIVFHGELGDNYIVMKNIVTTGIIPLLGPPTSHPWLSFGPIYYWVFTPLLALVQYSPVGIAYLMALLHSVLMGINYLVVSRIFSKKVAFISSAIITFSPAFLWITREARFFSLILLLFYPFFYFFVKKRFFWSGLWFGIMLNFHLTPIIYVPALLLYLWATDRKHMRKSTSWFFAGALIPQIPFIFASIQDGGKMLLNAASWIPYRIAGFLGLVAQNNVTTEVAAQNTKTFFGFLNSIFAPDNILPIGTFVCGLIILLGLQIMRKKLDPVIRLTFFLIVIGVISIFIHGSPPVHYYLPLFIPLVLLVSYILGTLSGIRAWVAYIFMAILLLINIQYFFSDKWFYLNQESFSEEKPVPYTLQLAATDAIILNAQGVTFQLKRIGPFDYFAGDYAQNYQYLLWKKGNEPVADSPLIYTIYEGKVPSANNELTIFNKGGIVVTQSYEVQTRD